MDDRERILTIIDKIINRLATAEAWIVRLNAQIEELKAACPKPLEGTD